jgi:hypothetical protein
MNPKRLVKLVLAVSIVAAAPLVSLSGTAPLTRSQSLAAFERFKSLDGLWKGRSTVGWTGTAVFRVIGRGSVVLQTTSFDDPEAATHSMASAIHMDGDQLILTHYCEAGNQPRLVASAVTPDGREITFTFKDGTNLPNRNTGHMDRVVFRFDDADHFYRRWTWYQNGQETWLEAISSERVRQGEVPAR